MRTINLLLGAVFGIALVVACGGNSAHQMLADMGMTDLAGADLVGVGDANAAPSSAVMLHCDKTRTVGGTNFYYAELSGTGLGVADAPHVAAYYCDPDYVACPAGQTCTGYALPANVCWAAPPLIAQDKILVQCSKPTDTVFVRVN